MFGSSGRLLHRCIFYIAPRPSRRGRQKNVVAGGPGEPWPRAADTPPTMTGVPRPSWLWLGLALPLTVLACATDVGGGSPGAGGSQGGSGQPGTAGTTGAGGTTGTGGSGGSGVTGSAGST